MTVAAADISSLASVWKRDTCARHRDQIGQGAAGREDRLGAQGS